MFLADRSLIGSVPYLETELSGFFPTEGVLPVCWKGSLIAKYGCLLTPYIRRYYARNVIKVYVVCR